MSKITINLDSLHILFGDFNDKTRLQLIKSLIYTAANSQEFCCLVVKNLNNKFEDGLD